MSECIMCNRKTSNPKFCSRSCSAKWTNKHYIKRKKKKRFCVFCDKELPWQRRKYCLSCNPNIIDWSKIPYSKVTGKRKYQKNSRIRNLARQEYIKSNQLKCCKQCGYDKHYEICHIKSISSHSPTDTVAEINKLSNLIALCPNCHWELDNGLLKLN